MVKDKKNRMEPNKAMVSIKYGDVSVSVMGESSDKAKTDAMDLFSMLEEKYSKHWENKVCRERTKYD
jgi:hypothetical protein